MTAPHNNGRRSIEQPYGRSVTATDRTRGCTVSIWLTPDEYRQLDAIAKGRNLSKAAVVRRLIHKLFAAQGRQE